MSQAAALMTADRLLSESSELGRCELIRGQLVMMSPAGGEHGRIAVNLAVLIGVHVKPRDLGEVYAAETGFVLERNPDTVLAPDVAFIARGRAAAARTVKYIPIPPDFAAEVLSPDDRPAEVNAKVSWWLDHGVRLVWVVSPTTRTVTAHRADATSSRYTIGDQPTLDPVLPGLTIDLEQVFE